MNYLWEVMIQAKMQGIPQGQIQFRMAKLFSAYLEIANTYMNQNRLAEESSIEVNLYYRFYDIFKELYHPETKLDNQFRDSLTNLILHQLAENDVRSGMTKEEYHKQLVQQEIEHGKFGEFTRTTIELFTKTEQQLIYSGILKQYENGCSMDLFRGMVKTLVPNTIVYHNNEKPSEVFIYVGEKQGGIMEQKLNFLIVMFLDLLGNVELYFEYHFGIIGIDETMVIDEIALC